MVHMKTNWNIQWMAVLWGLVTIAGAVLVALLIHYFVYKVLRRIARRSGSFLGKTLLTHTFSPARLLILVTAISSVLPGLALPESLEVPVKHILEITFIVGLAWLAKGFVQVFDTFVEYRLPVDGKDNLQARRIRTQVHLLRQIVIGGISFAAVAAALMTFPSIRSIGAGLFASAGLAGLAVGMAARPALENLIAGLQIAVTEPIRLDDVVIVEGEWGKIEEVRATYVVVRIWDLRRMVVPLSYFIEKPFQNWTRNSSDLLGTVFLYTDYTLPVAEMRAEYQRILDSSPLWDKKVAVVQVTDCKERTMEVRFLMSAANSSEAFELRCYVRERLIHYLQENHPHALSRIRADVAPQGTLTSAAVQA